MIRIVKSEFIKSAVKPADYPPTFSLEFAFVGRSNVGKSSLMNTILNRRSLAKVSATPGKTRLVNFFNIHYKQDDLDGYFTFVDLPGYGFAKVSKTERDKWRVMMDSYFRERLQLRAVFVLADIRHNADPRDAAMINMLKHYDKKCCLIATKSDKVAQSKQPAKIKQLKSGLDLQDIPVIPFSALKKKGVDKVLNWMESLLT